VALSVSLFAGAAQAGLAQPTINLSQSTNLADVASIDVSGGGFAANTPISILQCANGQVDGNAPCDVSGAAQSATDSSGDYSVAGVTVRRLLQANTTTTPAQYDCVAVGCFLVAYQNGVVATAPITFASGSGGGTPTIALAPTGPFADTQAITVIGSNFTPASAVTVVQCANAQVGGNQACAISGGSSPTADGTGAFSTSLTVRRTMHADGTTPDQDYDCAAVGCFVVAVQGSKLATKLLTFASAATGQALGTVKQIGGASLPVAADPSVGLKACANNSSAACVPIAITGATVGGAWNLFLPENVDYDIWVVNLGNTKSLGGPYDLFVPVGANAVLNPEIAVAIIQATVTQNGQPFAANTAGIGGCTNGETGINCPSLRFQNDNDGNGTVSLAVPPGTWRVRGFNTVSGTTLSQQNAVLDLASGDLVGPFAFTFGATDTPTMEGEDVLVQPVDPTTGQSPVTLTFDAVTESGTTTVTSSTTCD
jgi:phage gp45-like